MGVSTFRASGLCSVLRAIVVITVVTGCGAGLNGGGSRVQSPSVPSGLTASSENAVAPPAWRAGTGATNHPDASFTNSAPYYHLVSAVNLGGGSAKSSQVGAVPSASTTIQVNVDTLANRHAISPYVYGGAYPKDTRTITDAGLTVVRWGGNATSRYNWRTKTTNVASDWYFSDYGYSEIGDSDSSAFLKDVIQAGSNPLISMVMLDWVSKGSAADGTSDGQLYSFSKSKYKYTPCQARPNNADAGNGVVFSTTCQTNPVYVTGNDPHDAHVPLLDTATTPCPSWANGDCAGSVNRQDWTTALATAFGSAPHFYDMDNEIDIWNGTHRDIHPNPATYQELRDTYIHVAREIKIWDPAAVRLGPVSCCWWFYWNSAAGVPDKASHGGLDFLPWWLNEVYWSDLAAGTRSVDVFDIHAYPNGPDTSSFTQAQKQAAAIRVYRDWWDPAYVNESGAVNQSVTTQIQPLGKRIAFVIPRMRALANTIYPGTPLSITEWSAGFADQNNQSADFSTALGDAEGYGLLGRERVYLASRWGAPDPAAANYQALKLYTNYDGAHHTFGTTSVSATHNGDPSLFSVFAALSSTGSALTIMVVNGDPANAANVTFALNHFTPSNFTSYTLSQTSPTSIVASGSKAWSATQTFAAYSATLLVISGKPTATAAEWDLNPDAIRAPAGGTVTLAPKVVSSGGTVRLKSAVFDTYYTGGAAQTGNGGCSAAITISRVTTTQNGAIKLTAGTISTVPGFYHFTVTGTDGKVTQTQGGWLLVGNPPATLAKSTDPGSGSRGTNVTLGLTLVPGSSGGVANGESVFFTTDAGTLSSRVVQANTSGVASVTLTLPGTPGTVHVTAEGPYDLGHPKVTFTETSN